MIEEPKCSERGCLNFLGVKQLGDGESTEVVYCRAFVDGIPYDISYGDNEHLELIENQGNEVIFES